MELFHKGQVFDVKQKFECPKEAFKEAWRIVRSSKGKQEVYLNGMPVCQRLYSVL